MNDTTPTPESGPVQLKTEGHVGIILINNPPVNALSHAVRQGIIDCVQQAESHDDVKALIVACEGRTFIAGADISEFNKPMQSPDLNEVNAALEGSSKLTIAALFGTALGGGFEVAMSCDYRIALDSAKVGLPEIHLGIFPGAGGTQRLPRLIGAEKALEMIVTGAPAPVTAAEKLGAVDKLVSDDLHDAAIQYANELIDNNASKRKTSALDQPSVQDGFFDGFRQSIARKAKGLLAPENAIKAVEAATHLPFSEGLKRESELFLECLNSDQSKGMRHVFFAERKAAVVNDIPKDTAMRDIKVVAILGAGTMGGGIAMNFANAGIKVKLLDMNQEALDRGLGVIQGNYEFTVKKGKLSEDKAKQRMGLIEGILSYDDLHDVDLVIEAVFESMDVKKDVFTKLDKVCKPGCILATNTSTLDIDKIAACTQRPEDVVGMHFFSPANIMKLLEVVRGEKTAKDVVATAMGIAKKIKKVAVLSGVCFGFIGNRMFTAYNRESNHMVVQTRSPETVDKAMLKFGMAMGPMATGDVVGLDTAVRIRQATPADYLDPYGLFLERLVDAGRTGYKVKKGVYQYEEGSRKGSPDPTATEIIEKAADELNIKKADLSDEEIQQRCVYALINEACYILDEGIAQRPGDIDIVFVYGYGFPAYRGGPMFYADTVGVKNVYDSIVKFREQYGEDWKIAPLLEKMAKEGTTFESMN